jgi:asparagine synthetase B (glutamine-hydrolysing)
MGGFLFTTLFGNNQTKYIKVKDQKLKPNKYLSKIIHCVAQRGPDRTNIYQKDNDFFIHHLLHITGIKTPQPFVKDHIVVMFNGEIYNYHELGKEFNKTYANEFESDGECLIDMYIKYGNIFPQYLDGEFAIVLVDYKKQIILMSTDIFGTKPLYYSIVKDNIGIASYQNALNGLGFNNIIKVKPNQILILRYKHKYQLFKKYPVYQFDLKQHKTSYDDWITAFEKAIVKRATNTTEQVYVGLSSGYSSGSIVSVLEKYGIIYKSYSLFGKEDKNILTERLEIGGENAEIITITPIMYKNTKDHLQKHCQPFNYKSHHPNPERNRFMYADQATYGIACIANKAKLDGYKIYLSGQGGNEIFSNYVEQGWFPENLEDVFPWKHFFHGKNEDYLMKEDYVTGSYGLETRYPFLDKNVVQEFLWLTSELKNKHYKAPMYQLMTNLDYPFSEGDKVEFDKIFSKAMTK